MILGLKKQSAMSKDPDDRLLELKMSKSHPDSAIFTNDRKEEIKRKIAKAYCPEKTVENNPVLEYMRYMIFQGFSTVKIERDKKHGGDIAFENYHELEK